MAFSEACSKPFRLVLNCSDWFSFVRYKTQKKHQNLLVLMLVMGGSNRQGYLLL